ncbi:hypothetical protein JST97_37300 [bacterium]|nr:hypothetical protein [bacterium]
MLRRGSILILAIFFLFVVELLAFAFVNLIPTEMNSAGRTRLSVAGRLVAEAGLEYAVAWMENELARGREPTSVARPQAVLTRPVQDWVWKVTIEPDSQTPPKGSSNQRVYFLTSEASQRPGGKVYARLRCSFGQESFAAYTRFVDRWPAGTWVAAGPSQIRGRFHTNDVLRVQVYPGFYTAHDPDWPKGPTFMGQVTAAGRANTPDGVQYRADGSDPAPYLAKGALKAARYEAIYKGGRSGVQTGVAKIPMPLGPSLQSLAESAWGGVPAPSKDDTVYFNSGGGIYVSGSLSGLELRAPAGLSVQLLDTALGPVKVVEVHQGLYTTPSGTRVSAGSTVIEGPGAREQVRAALPNGVVFVEGNITGLKGTNRGPHTLVSRNNIVLAEHASLWCADAPRPAKYDPDNLPISNGANPLGLVCSHLVVPPYPHEGEDLFLFAAIICSNGGSGNLVVEDRDDASHGGAKLVLVGSLVEDSRTYWGSTQVRAGYGAVLLSDKHLGGSPPPNFPSTNHFKLVQAVFDVL